MATRKLATHVGVARPFPSSPLNLSASVIDERGLARAALDAVASDPGVIAASVTTRTSKERTAHLAQCAALARRTALAHASDMPSAPF